jgi:hypothetical protein
MRRGTDFLGKIMAKWMKKRWEGEGTGKRMMAKTGLDPGKRRRIPMVE